MTVSMKQKGLITQPNYLFSFSINIFLFLIIYTVAF